MDLTRSYRLSEGVKARTEEFGGLVYYHRQKALYVVGSPLLMSLLLEADDRSLGQILHELRGEHNLSAAGEQAIVAALASFEQAGIIHAA